MSHAFRFTVLIATSVLFPISALAEGSQSSGMVTSTSRSASISTASMPRGSEMWAMWISLPAGKKVELKEPKIPSTWMGLEMGLTGHAVSAPLSANAAVEGCMLFGANGQQSLNEQKITTHPGDALACNFSTGTPYWEENRGDQLYSRAQLNVGGPWAPGTYDTYSAYRAAGGDVQAQRVNAISLRGVEEELRAAGMMTATTRIVTMAPGSRSVMTDRYPTLRMVTRGELKWGTASVASKTSEEPKSVFKLGQFNWVEWTKPQLVVLSNESGEAAEFVEWSVAPASSATP